MMVQNDLAWSMLMRIITSIKILMIISSSRISIVVVAIIIMSTIMTDPPTMAASAVFLGALGFP